MTNRRNVLLVATVSLGLVNLLAGCAGEVTTTTPSDSGAPTPDAGSSTDAGPLDAQPPAPKVITVTRAGAGTGTVTSTPAGIDCGTTCSAPFLSGSTLLLTAAAAPGSTFVGWSGGACSGTGTCSITVSAAATITATFAPQQFALSVSAVGNGTVQSAPAGIDCGATCAAPFDAGTKVTLTATASSGSVFTGWSGAGCQGAGTCEVTVGAPTLVTATFKAVTYATWDPTWSVPGVTYSNGNLSITGATPGNKNVRSTIGKASGKWYWEIKATGGNGSTNAGGLGILESAMANSLYYIGYGPSGISFGYGSCCSNQYWTSWSGVTTLAAPPPSSAVTAGITYMFALDMDTKRAWFGQNGTWFNGGDPATNAAPAATNLSGTVHPGVTFYASSINAFTANFGQSAFAYPVPSGFAAGIY